MEGEFSNRRFSRETYRDFQFIRGANRIASAVNEIRIDNEIINAIDFTNTFYDWAKLHWHWWSAARAVHRTVITTVSNARDESRCMLPFTQRKQKQMFELHPRPCDFVQRVLPVHHYLSPLPSRKHETAHMSYFRYNNIGHYAVVITCFHSLSRFSAMTNNWFTTIVDPIIRSDQPKGALWHIFNDRSKGIQSYINQEKIILIRLSTIFLYF